MGDSDRKTCDRCEAEYNPYVGDRFWSGTYTITVDGESQTVETLCDDCHREVVRESD
jgi:hypothetical protein